MHREVRRAKHSPQGPFLWEAQHAGSDDCAVCHKLAFTGEEQSLINAKYTEIETYVDEMIDKFIMGVESLDHFDAFTEKVNSMGLSEILEVQQAAYDRYMR